MGGQVELEVDIPGTDRLMAAAFYVGYAPTQRSGVLRTGAGVALPLVVAQQTKMRSRRRDPPSAPFANLARRRCADPLRRGSSGLASAADRPLWG